MPLLEVTASELKMLRESIDTRVIALEAHRRATGDPFVAAAIGADIQGHIVLRQAIVAAADLRESYAWRNIDAHPAWEERKARYDAQQDADIGMNGDDRNLWFLLGVIAGVGICIVLLAWRVVEVMA